MKAATNRGKGGPCRRSRSPCLSRRMGAAELSEAGKRVRKPNGNGPSMTAANFSISGEAEAAGMGWTPGEIST